MRSNTALISIHPEYVDKIMSGEKRFEFRRNWAATPVDYLVIYATAPVQRIVAMAKVGRTIRASKSRLWEVSREGGAGISREKLFAYLKGKSEAVALELISHIEIAGHPEPKDVFGKDFSPPQSFRYLTEGELRQLMERIRGMSWA